MHMSAVTSFLGRGVKAQLGTCMKCMRTAFLAAVGSTLLAVMATILEQPVLIVLGAWLLSLSLFGLWLLHGWKFTQRSIRATALRTEPGPDGNNAQAIWTRRRILLAVARVLLFSAAASALPRSLRAEGCNCYKDDNCSCPSDFPQCVFNPTTGDAICCGPNATGCAGPTQTWCCAPDHGCSGDEGYCY
jgi:hypothetical protein